MAIEVEKVRSTVRKEAGFFRRILHPKARKTLFIIAVLAPNVFYYLFFIAYPMLLSLIGSFYDWHLATKVRKFIGLKNYINIFTKDTIAIKSLINSLTFMVYIVPSILVFSLLVALLLDKMTTKIRGFFTACFFLPVITSMIAVSMMWKWLYHPVFGLINYIIIELLGLPYYMTWLQNPHQALPAVAIMTVWRFMGYYAVILLAGLQGIPDMFYEAASIDGATGWKRVWHITLPLLVPTIVFVLVMSVINAMVAFAQIYVMTPEGGPARSTTVVAFYIYEKGIQWGQFGAASALAYILFGIVLVFTLIQLRVAKASWRY